MNSLLKLAAIGAVSLGLLAPASAQTTELKLATIAPGSSAYLAMTTFATLVNQSLDDVNISVDATGAATKHMIEVAEGKLDMSMASPTVYNFMKTGTAMYKEISNSAELAEDLRLIYWFPLGQYHVVVYADSGIETPADIRGKKVFLGPPGGGAWQAAMTWVKILTGGMEPSKDYESVDASWSSAFQGFQDRQFDVYVVPGIAPFPQLEQLTQTSKLRLLGFTKEEFEANQEAIDFTNVQGEELGIIPAGVYGDSLVNTGDIYTLGAVVGVDVRADLPDDLVYKITKAYWEAAKASIATHPWLASVTLDYAVQDGGMKLHPGALRYYEEVGVTIPDGSK